MHDNEFYDQTGAEMEKEKQLTVGCEMWNSLLFGYSSATIKSLLPINDNLLLSVEFYLLIFSHRFLYFIFSSHFIS